MTCHRLSISYKFPKSLAMTEGNISGKGGEDATKEVESLAPISPPHSKALYILVNAK